MRRAIRREQVSLPVNEAASIFSSRVLDVSNRVSKLQSGDSQDKFVIINRYISIVKSCGGGASEIERAFLQEDRYANPMRILCGSSVASVIVQSYS